MKFEDQPMAFCDKHSQNYWSQLPGCPICFGESYIIDHPTPDPVIYGPMAVLAYNEDRIERVVVERVERVERVTIKRVQIEAPIQRVII